MISGERSTSIDKLLSHSDTKSVSLLEFLAMKDLSYSVTLLNWDSIHKVDWTLYNILFIASSVIASRIITKMNRENREIGHKLVKLWFLGENVYMPTCGETLKVRREVRERWEDYERAIRIHDYLSLRIFSILLKKSLKETNMLCSFLGLEEDYSQGIVI